MKLSDGSPLIVALDVRTEDEVRDVCRALGAHAGYFKIGSELFMSLGGRAVEAVIEEGGKVFLDLKFHDIPKQVGAACREAVNMGVDLLTVHTFGGRRMMTEAVSSVSATAAKLALPRPHILGVTVLTSLDASDLDELGVESSVESQVVRLASMARSAGARGVVCGAAEAAAVRSMAGADFLIVTPGISLAGDTPGAWDQKRTSTLAGAVRAGASHVVMGRSLLTAADPPATAEKLLSEIPG